MHKFYTLFVNWRSRILVFLTHHMALPVLRYIRRAKPFPYSIDMLQTFEKGSLGNELAVFLQQHQLQLLPYYAKHDIKHILLQYDTTGNGEVCLQCFMLGNRHISFPVAATVLYGFITMPEYWPQFIKAYRRGTQSPSIKNWNWFGILHQPVIVLRNIINKNNVAL
jgi:ubiquinone biosynthesis protein Coq4